MLAPRALFMSLATANLLGGILLSAIVRAEPGRELRDVVGVAHVHGLYGLSDQDYVTEGANQILRLGSRVIKLAFRDQLEGYYPFNCQWPPLHSLVEVAQTPYLHQVFNKPFTTYILMTFSPGQEIHYFTRGMTPEDIFREEQMFAEVTTYLLTEYRGTGKTFIFQNWESDWVLTPPTPQGIPDQEPDPVAVQGMIDWFNARQRGVEQARHRIKPEGVTVAHAAEVNLILRAMDGHKTAATEVIPHTHCDLYSYSCWDAVYTLDRLPAALAYLASQAPDSTMFGAQNVYLGEYGAAEKIIGGPERQLEVVRAINETGITWGVPYTVYWSLYCDGAARAYEGRPTNDDCLGLWLIRPDGSHGLVYDYLHKLLNDE